MDTVRENEIGRALLEVSALIEDTVAMHRDRESEESLVIPVEPDEMTVIATAEELIGQAQHSVDVSFAGHTVRSRAIDELLRALAAVRGDSVRIRLLFARFAPDWDRLRDHGGHPAASGHVDVRIARVPLAESIIVDGRSALLIADSAMGPQASLTRAPRVAEALCALFTAVWRGATPVPGRTNWGERARSEFVGRILGCLHAGMTDELAARELSVSLRTYRRYVGEITAALGANSRFQAGLYAAKLGLLPVTAPHGAVQDARQGLGFADIWADGTSEGTGSFL